MYRITWTIKASKLCNLRCRYCYEWEELDKPDRIALADWAKVFKAIKSHNALQSQRLGVDARAEIVWHGGEPLLLPSRYMREVLALQQEILGRDTLGRGTFANAVQTNLYALTDEKLELLKEGGFKVGVSMDLAGGVRLSAGGRQTEDRVAANMDRLAEAGIPFGAIVVLAAHTAKHLRTIYDFMEHLNVSFRVLPLFPSPLNTPEAAFAISSEEMVAALNDLFLYWLERDFSVSVAPLKHYLQTALLHINGLESTPWRRREHGDGVLIVNTNGDLYQVLDAYEPELSLGNLFRQPIEEILTSPPYAASLDRNDAIEAAHCDACPFARSCNHGPVFESRLANRTGGHCAVAHPVQDFIAAHLRHIGFDESAFGALETRENAALDVA
ncbi:MAG TPA: radical SAM protein [Kiloniellaceae bacterium]|nr:radical SAM protein [Kiloniellaceae bacterium]